MTLAGLPDGFGRTRETTTRGVYKLVVSNFHEECTRLALDTGRELVLAAIKNEPFDLEEAIRPLRRRVDRKYLGPSTAAIVNAAEARKIPHIRLLDDGNLVQLGYGAAMRRIWTAETDQTSAIAETISRDKDLTQGTDLLGRRTGPRRPRSRQRRRCRRGRRRHRLPGRRQADRRQPRPRRIHRPDEQGRSRQGLRHRDRRRFRRAGRALHPGHRTPPADRRRQTGRRQPQRPDHRNRRWQIDRPAIDRHPGQYRPAPRHH